MKTRISCNKHGKKLKWHSIHAAYHCKHGACTSARMNQNIISSTKTEWSVTGQKCPVEIHQQEKF